jgi:hypothetical protein
MSLPTQRNDQAFTLAPHNLHGSLYNAQGSCSPYLLTPQTVPIVFDSAYYPSVDCQSQAYFDTPREQTGASGSIGIYGGYRETQSTEPQSPAGATGLPSLGNGLAKTTRLNYLGCPAE